MRSFLSARPDLHLILLARRPQASAEPRITVLPADLIDPDLGLDFSTRRRLQGEVTEIVHGAADTRFDAPLDKARATNTEGTGRLLQLARQCRRLEKFAYLSTVYVAGRSTGRFPETARHPAHGFVNAYQQSKFEAEQRVLAAMAQFPAVIFRLSTIIGDTMGRVQRFNYIHQLLKLLPHGHVLPMMPCEPHAPIDLITIDWVSAALAHLFQHAFLPGQIYQVCAGPEASLTMADLIDLTLDIHAHHPAARKWQPIQLPPRVDLATWEAYVRQALPRADILLKELLRVLNYFAAHLALFQVFENQHTLAGLRESGITWPPIRDCDERMVGYCLSTNWGRRSSEAPVCYELREQYGNG